MYNANIPNDNELPSTKQLLVSTLLAIIVAIIILVIAILPAEYGIDPTGVGKAIGLKQMGEIKIQLEKEAALDSSGVVSEIENKVEAEVKNENLAELKTIEKISEEQSALNFEALNSKARNSEALNSEIIQIELAIGQAAEVKVALNKNQSVDYQWQVDQGHLNFDNHGDNIAINYFNYSKGKAVTSDKGTLKAEFDGKHGWFWRNRSTKTVMMTLRVEGEFDQLIRVL